MDVYNLQEELRKKNEKKSFEKLEQGQKKETLQSGINSKGLIAREYELSRRRDQLEKEQAANPRIFKFKYKKKKELEDLRRRNQGNTVDDTVNRMYQELDGQFKLHGTDKVRDIAGAFEDCMKNTVEDSTFSPDMILNDDEQPKEISSLCKILKRLQKTSVDSFTQDEAKELIEEYCSLDLKSGEANSAHLLKESDYAVADIGAKTIQRNPQSAYILLYQCASVALRNYLNSADESKVDMNGFAMLCGISMSSTYAASVLCLNDEFLTSREETKEQIAIEEEIEKERTDKKQDDSVELETPVILSDKEKDEIIGARIKNLQDIIEKNKYKKPWFEDYYEEILKKAMSELFDVNEIKASTQQIENDALLKMNRTIQLLDKWLVDIENYVSERDDLTLGMPYLREQICAQLGQKIDLNKLYGNVLDGLSGKYAEQETENEETDVEVNGQADEELKKEDLDSLAKDIDIAMYAGRKKQFTDNISGLDGKDVEEFWKNSTVQSMILHADDKTFGKYVNDIKIQVKENERYIRILLEKRLTVSSRETAYNDIKKELGSFWFTSSPGVIADRAAEMLSSLNVYSPKAEQIDTAVNEALKKSDFPVRFSNQAQKYLMEKNTDMSDENMLVKSFAECKKNMAENAKLFCEKAGMIKLPGKAWKQLMTFETDNICIESSEFLQLIDGKLKEAKNIEDTQKISWNNFLYSEKDVDIQSQYLGYKERLGGSDLCEWEGFGGVFSEHKKAILEKIEELLKSGKLEDTFDFMKGIDNLDMLEKLTMAKYQELCLYFRANLGNMADKWSNINVSGAGRTKIQDALLDRMLVGGFTQESFDEAVRLEQKKEEKLEVLNERRLFYLLGSENEDSEQLSCNILKVDSKAQDEVVERLDRFKRADGAWKLINSGIENENQEEDICSLCQMLLTYYEDLKREDEKKVTDKKEREEIKAAKKSGLRDWLWNTLITGEDKKDRENLENQALQRIFDKKEIESERQEELLKASKIMRNAMTAMQRSTGAEKEVGRRYFFLEFMMCGMEKNIFGAGKKYDTVFNGKDEEKYQETLEKLSLTMISRRRRLNTTLRSLYPGEINRQKRSMIKERLADMLGGLEPLGTQVLSEDMARMNKEKYGVPSFEVLLSDIRRYARADGAIFDNNEINATAQIGKKRKKALEEYDKNVFRGLVPVLMKDNEVWSHMMNDNDEDFDTYMCVLKEKINPLINVLNRGMYKESIATVKLFVRANESEILKEHDEEYWRQSMASITEALLKKETRGGKSFEQKLKEAEKKYGDELSMRILSAVLRDNASAYEILYGKNAIERILEAGKDNYEANIKYMKNQIAVLAGDMDKKEADKLFLPFIQYMTERCILKKPEKFRAEYQNWYDDYIRQIEADKTPDVDRTILDEIQKVRIHAVDKRLLGIEKERTVKEHIDNLQQQVYRKCSPILASGDKVEPLTEKDIKKADKFIEKNYKDMPEMVKNMLREKYLSMDDPDEKLLEKDCAWLCETYSKFSNAEQNSFGDDKQFYRYFMFLYLNDYGKKDKSAENEKNDGSNSQKDVLSLYGEFKKRQKVVRDVAVMERTKACSFISKEIHEVMDCLNMGLYTMSDADFKALSENRMKYFYSASRAYRIIGEEVDKNVDKIGSDTMQVKAGFFEYFRSDILDGIDEADEKSFRTLVQQSIEKPHLCDAVRDFDMVLGAVSSDSLTAVERQGAAVTRGDFENLIAGSKDKNMIEQYNNLDEKQRKLFALALMIPGQYKKEELLAGSKLVNGDRGMNEKAVEVIKNQIKDYIEHEDFEPDIQYAYSLQHLKNEDGGIDKDVFKGVMTFTQMCVQQYQYNKPKDWERLNNGMASINEAMFFIEDQELKNRLKNTTSKIIISATNLRSELIEQAKADNEDEIAGLIEGMDDSRFKRIIVLLQRRSILDTSTRAELDKYDNFADMRGRAEILEKLKGEERTELIADGGSARFCLQAFLSLCSFQLRDDVDMTGRFLQKEDFAKKALSRSTVIDWQLFKHALEADNELTRYRLKIKAVRQAPELIEESKNEKAISVYKQYKDKETLTDEEFENFLENQAEQDMEQNDDIAALMAGYYALDDGQKSLFLRALEHRDILDVSKEDFVAAYLGKAERDYVNPQERDALANEYLRNASSDKNKMKLDNSQKKAVMSLLSRQIDDTLDFSDEKFNFKDKHFSDIFRRKRDTAVDWKLFSRALQFVNRTSAEARILAEDMELYISRGNLVEGGAFKFEGDYLRRNLHTAGNRVTHFFGRMAVDTIKEKIPAYDTLQNIMLDVSTNAVRRKIYQYGLAPEKENEEAEQKEKILTGTIMGVFEAEKDKVESANDKLESVQEKLKDKESRAKIDKYLGKEKTEKVKNSVESVSNVTGIIGTANDIIESVVDFVNVVKNINKLDSLDEKVKEEAKKDEKEKEQAAKRQTKEQKKLSDSGDRRNKYAVDNAKYQTYQHQYEKVIEDVKDVAISLTNQFAGDAAENYTAIADTAVECAFFVHQIFTDKRVMENYLDMKNDKNPKLIALRTAYKKSGLYASKPEGLDEYGNRKLLQTAMGYESFDELAQAVCLEIVRSLLFSAGEYSTSRANRVQSAMILSILGFEDMIGRQDSDAALAIYQELGGVKYK